MRKPQHSAIIQKKQASFHVLEWNQMLYSATVRLSVNFHQIFVISTVTSRQHLPPTLILYADWCNQPSAKTSARWLNQLKRLMQMKSLFIHWDTELSLHSKYRHEVLPHCNKNIIHSSHVGKIQHMLASEKIFCQKKKNLSSALAVLLVYIMQTSFLIFCKAENVTNKCHSSFSSCECLFHKLANVLAIMRTCIWTAKWWGVGEETAKVDCGSVEARQLQGGGHNSCNTCKISYKI